MAIARKIAVSKLLVRVAAASSTKCYECKNLYHSKCTGYPCTCETCHKKSKVIRGEV